MIIAGPDESPFSGGVFKLELFLPEEYPMAAPKVRFMVYFKFKDFPVDIHLIMI